MKTNPTFFSLIIPVYNIEPYIEKCLNSIVCQTFTDYEVLLIDDGSTDESGKICDRYCAKYDNWRVIHKANGGVSAARNEGILQSRGKWLIFIDGDDAIASDYLNTFYGMHRLDIDMGIVGVSVGNKNIVLRNRSDVDGVHDRKWLIESLVRRDSIRGFGINKSFSSEIVKTNHILFNTKIHMCEDLLFCMQYAALCEKVCLCNQPLYYYIQRDNSASKDKVNMKRLSVLDAYPQIIRIAETYGDEKSIAIAKSNLLIHNAQLYMMVSNNRNMSEISKKLAGYIRGNFKDLCTEGLEFKTWLRVIFAYLLCRIRHET